MRLWTLALTQGWRGSQCYFSKPVACTRSLSYSLPRKLLDKQQKIKLTYYDTLDVPRNATQKDIRDSFIRLSKLHHPDVNINDPSAKDRIAAINEAYTCLSDEHLRATYDEIHFPREFRHTIVIPKMQPHETQDGYMKRVKAENYPAWLKLQHMKGSPNLELARKLIIRDVTVLTLLLVFWNLLYFILISDSSEYKELQIIASKNQYDDWRLGIENKVSAQKDTFLKDYFQDSDKPK